MLLVGAGAEEFALEEGLALVPNVYFQTEERRRQLESERRGSGRLGAGTRLRAPSAPWPLDRQGNLAAATSTEA